MSPAGTCTSSAIVSTIGCHLAKTADGTSKEGEAVRNVMVAYVRLGWVHCTSKVSTMRTPIFSSEAGEAPEFRSAEQSTRTEVEGLGSMLSALSITGRRSVLLQGGHGI